MIYRICGFIGFTGTRLDNRRLFLRHAEAKVKNLRSGWHTCRKLHKLQLVNDFNTFIYKNNITVYIFFTNVFLT